MEEVEDDGNDGMDCGMHSLTLLGDQGSSAAAAVAISSISAHSLGEVSAALPSFPELSAFFAHLRKK